MSKRKNAWNKAKESGKKVLEGGKNIKKGTLNVIGGTAGAVGYTLLSAGEKGIAIASKHRKKKYSDKSKKHISKAGELGIQAIKGTGETLKGGAKIVGYSVKGIHHSVDTVDKAIGEQLEKIGWKRKLKFLRDNIIKILVPTLIIGGVAGGTADIIKADKRKNADREKYGAIELKNNEAKTFEESTDNIVYYIDENGEIIDSLSLYNFFDETLKKNGYENDSIISSTGLITTITSENALKSKGKGHKIDKRLEKHGAERSKNSESIIGKFLAYIFGKNGSYGLFQTQREAIENGYKNNPERYNNICKTIANFKLPNNNGEREELCKQLNYKSENEMISDLKEKNLPIYTGGEKLGIALGIVLLNEQGIDRDAGWKRYKNNYANIIENTQKIKEDFLCQAEGPIRQALTREKKEGEALKSIYILTESTEKTGKDRISFRNIQETLKSPEFRAGEIAAGRCTDIQARKNGEYLLDLSIAELNQRFNNEINGNHDNLNITSPTGTFGPTSTKLAIKHLKDYLPEEIKDNANSEEIKNYLDKHPEIIKEFKDKVIADYIINFRRLFLLNGTKEEINEGKSNWNELNEKQMDFLEQNLNLSFNHLYISEQCFHEYVKEKSGSTNELDSLRNDYITNVEDTPIQKEKRKKITKIITHEKEFMNSTGLTKEDYEKFIKHRLGPTLIGTSIILSETGNVVPENQEKRTGTSNEVNTIYRFYAGTKNELTKMEEATKGIPITINSGDISFNSIRYAISKNETIMEYLKNNCRDPEGNPITNINQISDNIIAHFILNNKINHKVLTQAFSGEKALKLYFNINNEEQILSDKYNEGFVFKGENFCEFIFNAQNQLPNSRLSKILKNIIGKDSINKDDITAGIIRQIIRKPDGSIRENINDLKANEGFIIVYPLNKKSNNSRNGPIFNTEKGRDEGLLLDWRYEEMYNKKLETEKATKKGINKTLSEKSNTRTGNKEGRDIQDPKKKTPTPKNPITPKKHIPQKK